MSIEQSIKLIDYSEPNVWRGAILRCKGEYPYETMVDFLVCESWEMDEGARLVVASGYKAGLTFVVLPVDSISPARKAGINTEWLRVNWYKWGYADCPLESVWLVPNTPPEGLPFTPTQPISKIP